MSLMYDVGLSKPSLVRRFPGREENYGTHIKPESLSRISQESLNSSC